MVSWEFRNYVRDPFDMAATLIAPDSGERFIQPGARVAYLAQEPSFDGFATVHDYVAEGLPLDDQDALHRVDAVLDRLQSVHGGLWRTAYAPRSALGLAALLGLGAARG